MSCHQLTADETFSLLCLREARKTLRRAFSEGDTPFFVRIAYYPKVSSSAIEQMKYWVMRLEGQSHNMAEVLATRKFPGTRTDADFNRNRCNGNQFEKTPLRGDWYRARAEEAGVSTTGKFYHDSLADYPGDPTAWVSDRSDVLRVAREKGYRLTGLVDYTPPECEPAPDVEIDPDLIDAEVAQTMADHPGAREGDVREKVYELRTGRVDPNPLLVNDPTSDFGEVDFS